MNIKELKDEQEKKVSALIKECRVFFAFSNKQFDENKTELKDGEKYARIYGGGYLPQSEAKNFNEGLDDIHKWYRGQVKALKLAEKEILYELSNHECFYTGYIDGAMEELDEYSREDVLKVFNKYRKMKRYQ